MRMFNKIAIIGVGLMGGSIGLACKKRKIADKIIGVCRRATSAKKAIKFKAVDEVTLDLKKGVKNADLVVIASSVGKIEPLASKAVKFMKEGAILTDVGSSKSLIVKKLEKITSTKINFIGSHPMAGSDKSGVWNAGADIFLGATLILTKTNRTNKKSLSILKKFWENIGCNVIILSPERHDRHASFASYLPHLVSFALASSQTKDSLKFAAGSLKSTTRVASSDPELWKDIFLSARKPTLKAIKVFSSNLLKLEKAIRNNDGRALETFLNSSKKISDSIIR